MHHSNGDDIDGFLEPTRTEREFSLPKAKRRRISTPDEDFDGQPTTDQGTELKVDGEQSQRLTAPSRIQIASDEQSSNRFKPSQDGSVPAFKSITTTDGDFQSLKVAPWLVHSLAAMAIHQPTEIQRSCIPEILKGHDCIGGSRTGTGKTVAFAVPILQKWAEDPFGIYAVVLTPTRELALQIYEQFSALGGPHSLKTVLITGGSEMRPQATALSRRPHIVVATPGRLADHILTSGAETIAGLRRTKFVVLDEADRLLTPGSGSMLPDLKTCLTILPPPSSRSTLLFTATVTPEVRALKDQPRPSDRPSLFISEITSNAIEANIDASASRTTLLPATLRQTYLQVPLTHKDAFLHVLLSVPSISSYPNVIIFVNRTQTADMLHRTLLFLDHSATSLHSNLPQRERNKNLTDFRAQQARILVATDVAGRGLDIPNVSLVINFDVPRNPVDYVHRVGRTARAGRQGTSITFVGQRDVELVHAIEAYIGGRSGRTHDHEHENGSTNAAAADPAKDLTDRDKGNNHKMVPWTEENVNIETRVVRGTVLKEVGAARMEALREVEAGKDVRGWRRKIKKDRKAIRT